MPSVISGDANVSATEFGYLDGVTSALQTQMDAKAASASPTFTGNVVWSGATLRAATDYVATAQTTTSTSFTDLATAGPTVTLTTGTKALVILSARIYHSTGGYAAAMGYAVSGATTISADFSRSYINNSQALATFAHLQTGLTAGSNTFTAKYASQDAGTSNYQYRYITVIDLGS